MDIPRPTMFGYSDSSTRLSHYGLFSAAGGLHEGSHTSININNNNGNAYRTPRNNSFQTDSAPSRNFSDLFGNVASHENTFREIFGMDLSSGQAPIASAGAGAGASATPQSSKNILTTLPLDVLNLIVSMVPDQTDLVRLGQTCSPFNALVNPVLYNRIQLVDSDVVIDEEKAKNYISCECTYLKVEKLKLFVRSIINNFGLLDALVHEIVILTNSDKPARRNAHDDLLVAATNRYEILYDLVSKSKNHSLVLLNFDFPNLKMFGNYMTFVKNKYMQSNRVNLYEQFNSTPSSAGAHEVCLTPSVADKFTKNLKFYQLSDLSDLNILPLSIDKLSFFSSYGGNYIPTHEFHPSYNGLRALYNLNSLYLNSPLITKEFFNKVAPIFQQDSLEKVRLHTLSITYTHNDDQSWLNFFDIHSIFDLNYLKNLELKAKCFSGSDYCGQCLVDFFHDWQAYDEQADDSSIASIDHKNGHGNIDSILDPSTNNHNSNYATVPPNQMYLLNPLAASSYCYFPSNSSVNISGGNRSNQSSAFHKPKNNLVNIEKLSLINNEPPPFDLRVVLKQNQYEKFVINYFKHFTNLKYVFLNSRDFVDVRNSSESRSSPDEMAYYQIEFKKARVLMFKELLKLKDLKTLVIPDYFQNWSTFLDNNYDMNNIDYVKPLNNCGCSECGRSRAILETFKYLYHSAYNISSNRINISNGILKFDSDDFSDKYLDLSDSSGFHPLLFEILKQLKSRLPFSSYPKYMTSGLDLLKYPINQLSHSFVYDFVPTNTGSASSSFDLETFKVDFEQNLKSIIKLIIHSVRSQLKLLIKNLPQLETLVLGGIYFHVDHADPVNTRIQAIYDDYEEYLK